MWKDAHRSQYGPDTRGSVLSGSRDESQALDESRWAGRKRKMEITTKLSNKHLLIKSIYFVVYNKTVLLMKKINMTL